MVDDVFLHFGGVLVRQSSRCAVILKRVAIHLLFVFLSLTLRKRVEVGNGISIVMYSGI